MTDEELAVEICPDNPCEGLVLISRMDSLGRAGLQRLVEVGRELNEWTAGVGPKPRGVIVCKGHGRMHR